MYVKNEWPTANINFAVVIQKSVVIFLCRAICLAATVGRGRASYPPLIFQKILYCVAIELLNLKDIMKLMQKTYLIPVQIGMPLANASKICTIYGYSTLPDYW